MTSDPETPPERIWIPWLGLCLSFLVVIVLYIFFSYVPWSYYTARALPLVLLILVVLCYLSYLYRVLGQQRKVFRIGKLSLPGIIAIINLILVGIAFRLCYGDIFNLTRSMGFSIAMSVMSVLTFPIAPLVFYLGIDYEILDYPYPFLILFVPLNAYLWGYVFAIIIMLFRKKSGS